jgi:hypothetical protein
MGATADAAFLTSRSIGPRSILMRDGCANPVPPSDDHRLARERTHLRPRSGENQVVKDWREALRGSCVKRPCA